MSDLETIVDPVERMTSVMARAAEAAELAVTQHGEKAVELALLAARVEAIQVLTTGVVFLGMSLISVWLVRQSCKWVAAQRKWDDDIGRVIATIVSGLGSFGFGAAALLRLASIKAWVGAFVPEYWIAAKALESIL